jgi:hypothetical protein
MASQYQFDTGAAQRLQQVQVFLTRNTEHVFDTFVLQALHNDIRGLGHFTTSVSVSACAQFKMFHQRQTIFHTDGAKVASAWRCGSTPHDGLLDNRAPMINGLNPANLTLFRTVGRVGMAGGHFCQAVSGQ